LTSDASVIASATITDDPGIDWLDARTVQVHDAHLSASFDGLVTLAVATTIASVTAPEAGGFVHRRATQLMVYGPDGRLRFDHRLGGRAEHVQPRAVAALGDGGVLLAAAFPDDFPLFAPETRRRHPKKRSPTRPQMVLRLVRFSAGGDPSWVQDLGEDGAARIGLTDEHAWIIVTRVGATTGHDTQVLDIDPHGERRWETRISGWRALAVAPDRSLVRLVGTDTFAALQTLTIDETGEPTVPIDLVGLDAHSVDIDVSVGAGQIVVASLNATDDGSRPSVIATAFDGTGMKRWERGWQGLGICGRPLVRVGGDGRIAMVQPLCELDGSPSGFEVDRLDADGHHLWRQRLGGPGSGSSGTAALALTVDDAGHVVVTGRSDRPAHLGDHALVGESLFVTRLRP
jgi:hypothetical protein